MLRFQSALVLVRDMVRLPLMLQGSSKASGCFSGRMCTMQNRTDFSLFLQCLIISPSRFVRPYMPCSKLRQQVKPTHANWISRMTCAQGKVLAQSNFQHCRIPYCMVAKPQQVSIMARTHVSTMKVPVKGIYTWCFTPWGCSNMLTSTQLVPDTLSAYCGSGADWQTFNATQKEVRKDMLRLYGNKRHLVPPRSPFELAGPTGPATQALFLLQVSTVLCRTYKPVWRDLTCVACI